MGSKLIVETIFPAQFIRIRTVEGLNLEVLHVQLGGWVAEKVCETVLNNYTGAHFTDSNYELV